MNLEWDPAKAEANSRKHGARFEETRDVFDDPYAITIADEDSDPHEKRFVSMGVGALGRLLVVVYTYREENIRILSARPALAHELSDYEKDLP